MKKMIYKIDRGCTYCGECVHSCPVKAIKMGPDGAAINQDKCIGCGLCYENCASEAISKKCMVK